ncbi:MAG: ATP-binding cassette domain-containing protein [Desulfovermiculus sp.]|nr:ATP-binding cassette domain-containing protein [Desulfovermiculus sp.]
MQQNPAQSVSHRFNVLDIVAEPLQIQKISRDKAWIRQKALQALQDVNLATDADFIRRYPHELNMGALQRVCMARALVTDPDLLVADEPTSSLDPSVQAKVLKMILGLQIEKGLTLLFVTHDLDLAGKIADRAGVMLSGRLVELGPAARVLQNPAHPYTWSLLQGARGCWTWAIAGRKPKGCSPGATLLPPGAARPGMNAGRASQGGNRPGLEGMRFGVIFLCRIRHLTDNSFPSIGERTVMLSAWCKSPPFTGKAASC